MIKKIIPVLILAVAVSGCATLNNMSTKRSYTAAYSNTMDELNNNKMQVEATQAQIAYLQEAMVSFPESSQERKWAKNDIEKIQAKEKELTKYRHTLLLRAQDEYLELLATSGKQNVNIKVQAGYEAILQELIATE